ncbi:LuxR C-terminal-related transcriptional regulator [Enterobacter mori]|uniref:LuxR C-terminal-related transcriptional regulator n=1 Tax=Enterobacter mori TaxID=539813 RepID=UPI0032AEFA2F
MISILIKDIDSLFMSGMRFFFNDFFAHHYYESVSFLEEYHSENIARADIIVLSLCKGERYTCFPELQARTRGIIIGLVDEEQTHELSPGCLSDIVYITRSSSLTDMDEKVNAVWKKWKALQNFDNLPHCLWCKHRQMSEHQFQIMGYFHQGIAIKSIAKDLGMSSKTIFAHKYLVMQKFNLRNDIELKYFLDMLVKKESILNSFRQRVVR